MIKEFILYQANGSKFETMAKDKNEAINNAWRNGFYNVATVYVKNYLGDLINV